MDALQLHFLSTEAPKLMKSDVERASEDNARQLEYLKDKMEQEQEIAELYISHGFSPKHQLFQKR